MRAALAFLLLAGCDRVFELEPVEYTPPDAAPDGPRYSGHVVNDPDRDYDGDGEPNATDLCALIADTEPGGRDDSDGDGVGDLCDPNRQVPGDCLVLFDSFEASSLSSHWKYDGEMITRDPGDFLHIPGGDETLVYLDQPLDISAVYVEGYIHYGANGPGDRFAVQLFVDVTRSPAANGTACSLESTQTDARIAIAEVTAGVDQVGANAPIDNHLVTSGTNAQLRWDAEGCYGELADGSVESATTPTAPPPSSVFGIRTLLAGFNVFVVAAYGHGCDG